MQISLDLSEKTIQQLSILPDANSFVEEALKKALQNRKKPQTDEEEALLIHEQLMEQYAETFEKLAQ